MHGPGHLLPKTSLILATVTGTAYSKYAASRMSNRVALARCEDLILALAECQQQHNFLEKAAGACFDMEKAVRLCRHEARLEDRRKHVEANLEKRRRQEERWQKIDNDEDV